MAGASVVVMVATVWNVVVAARQWRELKRSNAISRQSADAAQAGAEAAKANEETRRNNAETAAVERSNVTAEKLAAAAQESAKAAARANVTSQKNAAAALETARLEQRAWLGVKDVGIGPLEAGKPKTVEAAITNTGKTAAKQVKPSIVVWFDARDLDIAVFAKSDERPRGVVNERQSL